LRIAPAVRSIVLGWASNDAVVRSIVLGWASNDTVVRSIHSLSCAHRTVFKEDSELKKMFRHQDLIPYIACVIQLFMSCSAVCHMYRHSGLVLRLIGTATDWYCDRLVLRLIGTATDWYCD
jgi:hypothetical protein